jgi:hypothetical protein
VTTTSQPAAYSPISSDTIDTITISGTDTIAWDSLTATDTSNSITYVSSPSSYTYSTSGTITFPSISTVQIGAINSIDTSSFTINLPEEWVNQFPDFDRVQKMCKEYPALYKVWRNFKSVYDMTLQDYKGKKDEGALI